MMMMSDDFTQPCILVIVWEPEHYCLVYQNIIVWYPKHLSIIDQPIIDQPIIDRPIIDQPSTDHRLTID